MLHWFAVSRSLCLEPAHAAACSVFGVHAGGDFCSALLGSVDSRLAQGCIFRRRWSGRSARIPGSALAPSCTKTSPAAKRPWDAEGWEADWREEAQGSRRGKDHMRTSNLKGPSALDRAESQGLPQAPRHNQTPQSFAVGRALNEASKLAALSPECPPPRITFPVSSPPLKRNKQILQNLRAFAQFSAHVLKQGDACQPAVPCVQLETAR